MPTPTDILTYIAPISEYLASNDVSNGSLFGQPANPNLPIQLYVESKAAQFRYDYEDVAGGSVPSDSLVGACNYILALCGRYGLQAISIVNSGGAVPGTGGGSKVYGYPISGYYIATTDGETTINLSVLPEGTIISQVFKSIDWLPSTDYLWEYPTLTLLNGVALSFDEKLSFLYVVPVIN